MKPHRPILNKSTLRYGLMISVIPVLYNTVLFILGLHLEYEYYGEGIGVAYERVTLIVMPVILIVALNGFKRNNSNSINLSQAFKQSLSILLVVCAVAIAYNMIFRTLAAPDFSTEFYEINRDAIFAELVECCDYSEEDLENHERTNGRLSNKLSAFVFTNFIFGMITTLITGLIIRRSRKEIS